MAQHRVSKRRRHCDSDVVVLVKIISQLESRVPCLEDDLIGRMDYKLEIFWNIAFSVMIVTAMCGNCAVLWIVFRK